MNKNFQDRIMCEHRFIAKCIFQGLTIAQIAKKLNCSIGKVKVILYRVRKIIRKNLEDGGYGYGK